MTILFLSLLASIPSERMPVPYCVYHAFYEGKYRESGGVLAGELIQNPAPDENGYAPIIYSTWLWRRGDGFISIPGERLLMLTSDTLLTEDDSAIRVRIVNEAFAYAAANPPARATADFDGDEDVDQVDFGHLQLCLGNAGLMPVIDGDLTGDLIVDADDVREFAKQATGAR